MEHPQDISGIHQAAPFGRDMPCPVCKRQSRQQRIITRRHVLHASIVYFGWLVECPVHGFRERYGVYSDYYFEGLVGGVMDAQEGEEEE